MQEDERKLRQIRALRRRREAEQVRLAAELHAHEKRLRDLEEARERAGNFLEGDLPLFGLLDAHALRETVRADQASAEERRLIHEISHRNVQSKAVKDKLVEVEVRLGARVEQARADNLLMETVAAWPSIARLRGDGEA